jgi:hypothetical protein
VVIIIDDEEEPDFCFEGSRVTSSPTNTRSTAHPKRQKPTLSTVTPTRPNLPNQQSTLSPGKKVRLCSMWRNNHSISEIAIALEVDEFVLRTYIYDLVKKDTMGMTLSVSQ